MRDLDRLLEIAKNKVNPESVKKEFTQIDEFIRDLQIKPGPVKIEAMRVWFLYKKWKKNNLLTKSRFFIDFSERFKKKRCELGVYYFLDPKPFDLTKSGFWEYRKQLRDERQYEKAKKTISKKKS